MKARRQRASPHSWRRPSSRSTQAQDTLPAGGSLSFFRSQIRRHRHYRVQTLSIPRTPRPANAARGTRFGGEAKAAACRGVRPRRRGSERERHDKQAARRFPDAQFPIRLLPSPAPEASPSRKLDSLPKRREPAPVGATWRESGRHGDKQRAESAPNASLAAFGRQLWAARYTGR